MKNTNETSVWTARVTFAHTQTGKEREITVSRRFDLEIPMIDIVDELHELAYGKLGSYSWDLIDSDEREESVN